MKRKRAGEFALAVFLSISLLGVICGISSCGGGGGGGGGGGESGISYTGLTTQATLTASNANKIFAVIWYEGASSGNVSPSPAIAKAPSSEHLKNSGMTTLFKRLKDRLSSDFTGFAAQTKNSMRTPVYDTSYGSVSGTLTITGNIDPNTMTGTLTMTYVNFNDGDGYTYDGVVNARIDGYDMTYGIITDMTMSFSLWTIKSASYDISMTGSIREQISIQAISDTMTINVVSRDNVSKETSRFENYVQTMTYNSIMNPTSALETDGGRVYVGEYGYVDVSTISPCIYSAPQAAPDSGGPIMLSGAGSTKASITPISASNVKIEVDDDGDDVFESQNVYLWSDLSGAPLELAPIANAGPDQSVATGSTVTLNGSMSTDPLSNPLSYAWTMIGAPAGSAAMLSSPTSSVTTFKADLPGTYTITLSVNNGKTSSTPDTIVVTAISNGLVAYYPFSGNANDASGHGNNGVVTGATLTTDRLGEANSAYNFDGIDDTILINASSSLNVGLSDGLTIAVWINTHNLSVEQQVVEWGENDVLGIHFSINTPWAGGPGSLYANLWNNMNEVRYIWTGPNILTANIYQHIAVTYDKTTGVASLYLNGVSMATTNFGTYSPNTSGNLHIGARISQANTILNFIGNMDDLRIYNRVLSETELILLAK